jgi:hypothetical protein
MLHSGIDLHKRTLAGLLAPYNVTTPEALPPLVPRRTTMLAEQYALCRTPPNDLGPTGKVVSPEWCMAATEARPARGRGARRYGQSVR